MRRMTSGKRKWAHENPERFFGENSLLTLLAKLEKKRLTNGVLFGREPPWVGRSADFILSQCTPNAG